MNKELKKWQAPQEGSMEEKNIFDLLKTFSSTLRKIPLYPQTHPMVKESIVELYFCLEDFFKVYGKMILDIIDNNILICEQPLGKVQDVAKDLIVDLKKLNIKGITLEVGLTDLELGNFLELLTLKPEVIKDKGGIKKLFEEKNITHIHLSEIRYARIAEDEKVTRKDNVKLETDAAETEKEGKDIVGMVSDFLSGKKETVLEKELISFQFKKNARRIVKQLLKLVGPEKAVEEVLQIIQERFGKAGFTQEEQQFYLEEIKKEVIKLKQPKISKKEMDKLLQKLKEENEILKDKMEKLDLNVENKIKQATAQLVIENQKVKKEREKINTVLRSVAEGLVIVDNEGKVLLLNPAAEKLLGINKEEKIGKHILEGLKDEHVVSLSKEKLRELEIELAGPNNETKKTLRASTAVIENENGQTVGMVSVLSDITKQKELDLMKNTFVSNVSHELRAPLISIQKSISLTLEAGQEKLTNEQKRFLEIASNNAKRLTNLINDLLDISKLEAGRVRLEYNRFKLIEVVAEVLDTLKAWSQSKQITLIQKDLENIELNADAKMLNQVFTNLIGNAIKFTPSGGSVAISAQVIDDKVKVCVTDTGCGIPENSLKRIFAKFEQVTSVPTGETKGTGLGLAIVDEIIKLHGGQIWAESELGKGSDFIFMIPKEKIVLDIRD